MNLTWLARKIAIRDGKPICEFSIDRVEESCKTPRRNREVEEAWEFGLELNEFAQEVERAFALIMDHSVRDVSNELSHSADTLHNLRMQQDIIFDPIIPLFENNSVLPPGDYDLFLSKHATSLDDFIAQIECRERPNSFLSSKDTVLLGMLSQFSRTFQSWYESIQYVEEMLRSQLIQAIGKRLSPQDFDEFISFYSKRIFAEPYRPGPFSYAVRRENHYPDGMFSIESEDTRVPINTAVKRVSGTSSTPLKISIDASTSIEIGGDRLLHGWIQHRWGGLSVQNYERRFVARAHQFSSFLVILGVMGPTNTFIPKNAIILQNKDEILIPLLNKVLPSAKEFTDSIKSLSPEQRAFAATYRRFELESSVFGVCVIQIKPQLGRLLNLPDGT